MRKAVKLRLMLIECVGSLVARIIFQPVEETLLLHFSTTSPSSKSAPHLLSYALHISIHLLLLLPAFLPPLLPAILLMLLPRRYLHTSAPATLQTYLMWYLPLLSLNGILEAFHSSSARPDQVATQARWMIGGSLVFTMILFSLTRLPDGFNWDTEQALIFANCMSMFVRIEYAWRHARIFFDGRNDELRSKVIAPRWQVALAAGISGVALRLLERSGRWRRSWLGWIELVGLGGGLGLGALGILCVLLPILRALMILFADCEARFIVERRGLAELRRIMKEGKTE